MCYASTQPSRVRQDNERTPSKDFSEAPEAAALPRPDTVENSKQQQHNQYASVPDRGIGKVTQRALDEIDIQAPTPTEDGT